jgi:hypothetical protein
MTRRPRGTGPWQVAAQRKPSLRSSVFTDPFGCFRPALLTGPPTSGGLKLRSIPIDQTRLSLAFIDATPVAKAARYWLMSRRQLPTVPHVRGQSAGGTLSSVWR